MSSRSDELDWDSNESLDFLSSSIDNKLEIIVIILIDAHLLGVLGFWGFGVLGFGKNFELDFMV